MTPIIFEAIVSPLKHVLVMIGSGDGEIDQQVQSIEGDLCVRRGGETLVLQGLGAELAAVGVSITQFVIAEMGPTGKPMRSTIASIVDGARA